MESTTYIVTDLPEPDDDYPACKDIPNVNQYTCVSYSFITGIRLIQGICAIIGITGAILNIVAIATHKKLRVIPNLYILNLSIADILVCGVILPVGMYTLGQRLYQPYCSIIGIISLTCLMLSVLNMSLVAVNRYVVICRSRDLYMKLYTYKTTIGSIIFTWAITLLLFSPPFYGFGSYDYNKKFGVCLFQSADVLTYWFVFSLADCTIMFPTLPITLFCYLKIWKKFSESQKKVGGMGAVKGKEQTSTTEVSTTTASKNTTTTSNMEELKKNKEKESNRKNMAVIKNMVVIWATFLSCWMPLVLSYKIDYYAKYPAELYHIFFTIAQSNSAINFVVYCKMNNNFREAYKNILTGKIFKKGGVS